MELYRDLDVDIFRLELAAKVPNYPLAILQAISIFCQFSLPPQDREERRLHIPSNRPRVDNISYIYVKLSSLITIASSLRRREIPVMT